MLARRLIFLPLMMIWCSASTALGQQDPVVTRAVQYLQGHGRSGAGETALLALALIKAEVPASDSALQGAMATVRAQFDGTSYRSSTAANEVYTAAVIAMALSNADAVGYKREIDSVAGFLISKQNPNGSWDYTSRTAGDTSISQYAVLGLWEAENAGASVAPGVWDRAASWYLSTQASGGSWTYHRDEGTGGDTVSMTAAGVGSLLICARQLAPYRTVVTPVNPLLTPLIPESERKRYAAEASPQRIAQAIRSGIGWIGANFATGQPIFGTSTLYGLYGIERIGALADQETLGRVDWFKEGRRFIASTQAQNGGFTNGFGDGPCTCWAILFLTKSTAKTLRKIQVRRLGAGTLIGGRGLPSDLSTISVAGGHVVTRPMDGAVEGMLAVLEDPRAEDANAALAGLIARYQAEGPKALKPYKERFRKLMLDSDQGVRRVAAWSLARTGDIAVVPLLIAGLKDPDDGVMVECGLGLQLIARKVDGFGPPRSPSPEVRQAAIDRWRAWYETVRPSAAGSTP